MSKAILDKLNAECTTHLNSELNTRLLASSSALSTDKSAVSECYLAEYQQCIDEQMNVVNYINEQLASLDALKSCEIAIDTFIERLKAIHEYELQQKEIFEQILHELTKMNSSSQEERIWLLKQIDELIAYRATLTFNIADHHSSTTKLLGKSSDTFKNIL